MNFPFLVLKTKSTTESAKRVEQRLEETFGASIQRDMKGQRLKSKISKNSEAQKLEKKRIMRQKLERELTLNIESYVTRSVMDDAVIFRAPLPGIFVFLSPLPCCLSLLRLHFSHREARMRERNGCMAGV